MMRHVTSFTIISTVLALALAPLIVTASVGGPLAQMTQQERENSEIDLMLQETGETLEQARRLADRVEQLWNSGDYEQALSMFDQLSALVGLQNIDVGTKWRIPVVTSLPASRSPDVLISASDSVYGVELCIHRASGNLFAVLLLEGEGFPSTIRAYYSTDSGDTWYETLAIGTSGWWESISCEVKGDYYYMAINQTSSGRILLMRFSVSDGQHVNFPIAGSYVTIATLFLEDIVLTCPGEATNQMHLLGNDDGDNFWFVRGFNTFDAGEWYLHATSIDDVDRGLDAVSGNTVINPSYYGILVSYISSSDSLKIVGYDDLDLEWQQIHAHSVVTSVPDHTSISKHGDTVACVYEDQPGTLVNAYVRSSTGDGFGLPNPINMNTAYPYSTSTPVIEMSGGGGVGVCYTYSKVTPMQFIMDKFVYGPYDDIQGLQYLNHVSYAVNVASFAIIPDLECLHKGWFGVVYVTFSDNHQAYFSRVGCCNGDGIRGDADGSGGSPNVGDLSYLVSYLFDQPPGPVPPCFDEGDVDASSSINVGDLSHLVSYLFDQPPGPAPEPCP